MDLFIIEFHNFPAPCLPAFLISMKPFNIQVDSFHQCKCLIKNKGIRDMSQGVRGMSKPLGGMSNGACSREYVMGGRGKTVSLFLMKHL